MTNSVSTPDDPTPAQVAEAADDLAYWLEEAPTSNSDRWAMGQAARIVLQAFRAQAEVLSGSKSFCGCAGFKHAVGTGAIKEESHQVLDSKTGKLRHLSYYYIGPKDIRKALIFQHCPACGKEVRRNHDFLAEVASRGDS